jgi:CRP-like cAMP-binding protein
MLAQTASIPDMRSDGRGFVAQVCAPTAALFAGCPELSGVDFSYQRDEEIYGEGEPAEFVYKVLSGLVRTHKLLSDGRRQIGAFHFPGDLFGYERGEAHHLTAEAVADARVLVFRRRSLESLAAREVDVACRLWALAARDLGDAKEHLLLLGRKTAVERVAAFLLEMEARTPADGLIELPMSRRDIADYLGLTVETVSRAFTQLQSAGALQLTNARRVRVRNPGMLRRLES